MDRRNFVRGLAAGGALVAGSIGYRIIRRSDDSSDLAEGSFESIEEAADMPSAPEVGELAEAECCEGCCERAASTPTAEADRVAAPTPTESTDDSGRVDRARAIEKTREFDRAYLDDYRVEGERWGHLQEAAQRLTRVERFVGHGNFNLISFDDMLALSRRYSKIGAFRSEELELLDELFHADAKRYGFFGEKVITEMTHRIPERETEKIAGSGHYLLRGAARDKFDALRRDLGDTIVLTSGVRSLGKQFKLFLAKAVQTQGNLSQAARSLAPPGYSYHAIGDFDLGARGLGEKNFTASFAETREYQKMIELGYVSIRYDVANPYGVRHEPWHIKVV